MEIAAGLGIHKLACTKGSYAYFVPGPVPVLVDTGFPGRGPAILWECESLGSPPAHIVITHYDVDHIVSAAWLREPRALPCGCPPLTLRTLRASGRGRGWSAR